MIETTLVQVDGVRLSFDSDGTLWLAVVDANGVHSTSITDDGADALVGAFFIAERRRRARGLRK